MARGVNKVILIGNLGAEPEIRYMPSGSAIARISVATSDNWTDKQTGQKQERTEWHRVVFFNRLAEIVGEYLHKGSKVYVEGRIRTSKWQDKNGQDRYTTEIIANEMQMLDGRGSGGASASRAQSGEAHTTSSSSTTPPKEFLEEPVPSESAKPTEGFDDEIPF
ncbi:MAG: single-stranded DNA-binding protein [Gammaproteobacteria bacterium]|nr:single-stranded DNA-binding protein [Gammaproteobacteria bacterium]